MSSTPADIAVKAFFQQAVALFEGKEQELGRLDAAAGDGDHGAAMVRGLRAANAAVAGAPGVTAGELLVLAGSAFADDAGGASGALFGAMISAAGQKLGGGPYDTAAVCAALQAGLDMVMKLGKCKPGDKTMVDALAPFVAALDEGATTGLPLAEAWQAALPAAEAGVEATKGMVARRGRSSRLGERSLGHADPGATSVCYLLRVAGGVLGAA
jgi:phosphoenolpyruvate---glycerone phosphotransferase subunit DhaL